MLQRLSGVTRRMGASFTGLVFKLAKLSALAVTVGSLLVVLDVLFFPDESEPPEA